MSSRRCRGPFRRGRASISGASAAPDSHRDSAVADRSGASEAPVREGGACMKHKVQNLPRQPVDRHFQPRHYVGRKYPPKGATSMTREEFIELQATAVRLARTPTSASASRRSPLSRRRKTTRRICPYSGWHPLTPEIARAERVEAFRNGRTTKKRHHQIHFSAEDELWSAISIAIAVYQMRCRQCGEDNSALVDEVVVDLLQDYIKDLSDVRPARNGQLSLLGRKTRPTRRRPAPCRGILQAVKPGDARYIASVPDLDLVFRGDRYWLYYDVRDAIEDRWARGRRCRRRAT